MQGHWVMGYLSPNRGIKGSGQRGIEGMGGEGGWRSMEQRAAVLAALGFDDGIRHAQILDLMLNDITGNKQIARELGMSEKTVVEHLRRMKRACRTRTKMGILLAVLRLCNSME